MLRYVNEKDHAQNFSYKCHRSKDGKEIYSVNDITFHQQHGTYSTCGALKVLLAIINSQLLRIRWFYIILGQRFKD